MLSFLKNLFQKNNYQEMVLNGAIIIDVRTGAEYDSGHIANARNIPVDRIKDRVAELKKTNLTIICYCASGMRSGVATSILKANGIKAYNAGSFGSLSRKLQ
jgi:phage shock protein E